MKPTTRQDALRRGFKPLSGEYLKHELWMIDALRPEQAAAGYDIILVETARGVDVYRKRVFEPQLTPSS